jgi:uncharacterized membrane protein SpoIIM required for sporulation
VIVAHVMGIPVEESVLQVVPLGATLVTAVAIVGRAGLKAARVRFRRGGRAARD